MATKLGRMVTCLVCFLPISQTTIWSRSLWFASCDKLKTFYLYYHNTYGHQTWQSGCIQWGASSNKIIMTFRICGLVILISLIQIVGLQHKRRSRHQLLVGCIFAQKLHLNSSYSFKLPVRRHIVWPYWLFKKTSYLIHGCWKGHE